MKCYLTGCSLELNIKTAVYAAGCAGLAVGTAAETYTLLLAANTLGRELPLPISGLGGVSGIIGFFAITSTIFLLYMHNQVIRMHDET